MLRNVDNYVFSVLRQEKDEAFKLKMLFHSLGMETALIYAIVKKIYSTRFVVLKKIAKLSLKLQTKLILLKSFILLKSVEIFELYN